MSEIVLPDKETIEQYVVSALREIDLLNNHPETHHWSISMPYRDDDSDVIISNAVHCVKPLLTRVENLQANLAAALARAQAAEGEVKRLEAVVSRKQVVIESHWKTIERASKRCALLKSAAHDVYDMCFENDDQKQVRHLRRVLKVLGTKLYRSPNGE